MKLCVGILLVFVAGMFIHPPLDEKELISILIFAAGIGLIFWGVSEEND